jgi:hypothetical protein
MLLATNFSSWRPGFESGQFQVAFMVGKLALEQVFLRGLRLALRSIIPQALHIHLCLNIPVTRASA